MQADLERVLFDEATILRRLDEIAAQISDDDCDRELTVIAVLNGSLMFMADLLRRIPLVLKLDCLSVASYHGQAQTSGEVIFQTSRAAGRERSTRSHSGRHSRQRTHARRHSGETRNGATAQPSHLRALEQEEAARARGDRKSVV